MRGTATTVSDILKLYGATVEPLKKADKLLVWTSSKGFMNTPYYN